MSTPDSFHDALDRLEAGDEDAAAEVFHRFASRLIRLAGTRLNTCVRRQVDPEDVVQSVFRSFFDRQAAGQFELENWNSLWSLLVRIVVRNAGAAQRHCKPSGGTCGGKSPRKISPIARKRWLATPRRRKLFRLPRCWNVSCLPSVTASSRSWGCGWKAIRCRKSAGK